MAYRILVNTASGSTYELMPANPRKKDIILMQYKGTQKILCESNRKILLTTAGDFLTEFMNEDYTRFTLVFTDQDNIKEKKVIDPGRVGNTSSIKSITIELL